MIKYQRKIQNFYKMRDTLIAEGYKDFESIIIYDEIELREIAFEIIKEKASFYLLQLNGNIFTNEEYELLRKVLQL